MAAIAITPSVFSTRDSTSPLRLTWSAVTTAATSGAYLDLTGYKGDKVLIAVQLTASGVANSSTAYTLTVQCATVNKPSGYVKGDLTVRGSSTAFSAIKGMGDFFGPFDLSRFKDSNERINIRCTRGTNVASLSAIIIE